MKKILASNRTSQYLNEAQNQKASQFKFILSNQHSKQFHLIDNPDLIFQLAKYKFSHNQSQNQVRKDLTQGADQISSSTKLQRHKSQDESQSFLLFQKNQSDSNKKNRNISFKKLSQQPVTNKKEHKYGNQQLLLGQFQRLNVIKVKSQSKKQKQEKIHLNLPSKINYDLKQKENIQTRILSVPRPVTSNIFSEKNAFSRNKNKQKDREQGNGWKKAIQRRKYCEMKEKLQGLIESLLNNENFNFSQIFEYEQIILKDYLSSFVSELKKQCVQKGELIESIWNTFSVMINKTMGVLTEKNKRTEKEQLKNQLMLHEEYQQMYQKQVKKIKQLGKKYNQSKNVIDRLIYELRYKRKQVKKLYKNLALCNDKLNEYKIQHIDLQNEHVDLLMDANKINKDQATEVLKRKIQINKEKYYKVKVGLAKQKVKQKIDKEIEKERLNSQQEEEIRKQLFQKINTEGKSNKKIKCPNFEKQQSCLIEEFIQKFSNKHIQNASNQVQITQSLRIRQKISNATNTDSDYKSKGQTTSSLTQTTFSDKIQFSLIDNRSTQTPGAQKIKKTQNVEIQADGDQMRIVLVKAKMMAYKVMDLSFYFDLKKRDEKVKHVLKKTSSFAIKKEMQSIHSISQISSDSQQKDRKSVVKKRVSKNVDSNKQTKNSIFNSTLPNFNNSKGSNLKARQSNFHNNRNSVSGSKLHKKRRSEACETSRYSPIDKKRQQRMVNQKKLDGTYLCPQYGYQSKNRPSFCSSNIDSVGDSIQMNLQKQKYIQSYMMNKNQQYDVLDQSAIFQNFKDILLNKNNTKSDFFRKQFRPNRKIEETNRQDQNFSDQQSQLQFLNPKSHLSSCQKLQDNTNKLASVFQRTHKKIKSTNPTSLTRLQDKNFRQEKQNLKRTCFLNNIIKFTVKKSLIRRKLDQNSFNACKEKSQFFSITQKLDPFILDVQCLLKQNLARKKNKNQINVKNLNKFINMTILRSIDKITRNSAILQNLIRPLFECFELIYGAIKPQDIYRKMVALISDIISAKQNQNFKEFIFFLGLDKEKPISAYLTTFDVCLFLKLMERLNLGKIGNEIDPIFTTKSKVNSQLYNILNSQNISPCVTKIVLDKIQDLLQKLEDYVRQSVECQQQSKINLFKVSRMIVEEIIKIRINVLNKVQKLTSQSKTPIELPLDQIIKVKNEKIQISPILKIVDCCRISTSKKLYFAKLMEQLSVKSESEKGQENQIKKIQKNQLGILLIRIGLVDFQELQSRISILQSFNSKNWANKANQLQKDGQIDYENVLTSIRTLNCVQIRTNQVLNDILGDMKMIYEVGLIKNLETKSQFNKNI